MAATKINMTRSKTFTLHLERGNHFRRADDLDSTMLAIKRQIIDHIVNNKQGRVEIKIELFK